MWWARAFGRVDDRGYAKSNRWSSRPARWPGSKAERLEGHKGWRARGWGTRSNRTSSMDRVKRSSSSPDSTKRGCDREMGDGCWDERRPPLPLGTPRPFRGQADLVPPATDMESRIEFTVTSVATTSMHGVCLSVWGRVWEERQSASGSPSAPQPCCFALALLLLPVPISALQQARHHPVYGESQEHCGTLRMHECIMWT